ncbi:MAG TPA: signal recognition particle-docking protein FtsY [Anaerolineae bacterium]|nr:signal recognition particle-docking protein FtsY [Anaerolineae bacterium]HQH37905.1 signal recognition particle-docking protein FtsY [Anaerolineae bacterium]
MKGIFESLRKTRNTIFGQIANILGAGDINAKTWEDLEAVLIQGDVGVETSLALIERLRQRAASEGIYRAVDLQEVLREELYALLPEPKPLNLDWPLAVVLIVGVNGSGKTTSIGKLTAYFKREGRKVVLAAADTFRAAAMDQLVIWGERVGVPVITGPEGGDPSSVAYDAIQHAQAHQADMVIVDTAGRLHTQHNLMAELEKIQRVIAKRVAWAPHETFLVLDANTGQNGLIQAQQFLDAVKVSGIILAKLDGSAKGGMVLSIGHQLGLPVRFVGTGEHVEDLAPFDREAFVQGLLGKE